MGYLRNGWTIAALGGVFLGAGAGFWVTAPIDFRTTSVNAAPEHPVTAPSPTLAQPTAQPQPQHLPQSLPQSLPKPMRSAEFSPADRKIFKALLRRAQRENWDQMSLGDLTQQVGESFLGSDYRANLLDRAPSLESGQETLLASLQQFDCVLFVETALALAQTIRQPNLLTLSDTQAEQLFFDELQQYRYRNGRLDDYCSRLHYFSDWILDNQRRGLVQEMGRSLAGKPLTGSLSFMSQNWLKYPVLVAHPNLKKCISTTEVAINPQDVFYIPTQQISAHYSQLQSGDIIGVVTSIEGLDVTHSGLIYQPLNRQPVHQRVNQSLNQSTKTGLMHASVRSGIKISPDLEKYVARVDGAIGIVVARPLPLK